MSRTERCDSLPSAGDMVPESDVLPKNVQERCPKMSMKSSCGSPPSCIGRLPDTAVLCMSSR
eukprot:5168090-Prymnesium_polylepis.1